MGSFSVKLSSRRVRDAPALFIINVNACQFIGISRNTQLKLYMLSLTECVWKNNALLDTH